MSHENFLYFKNTYLKFSSSSPTPRFDFTSWFGKINNFSTQHSKWIKAFSTGIIIFSSYYYFKHCKHMNHHHQFPFFSYFYRVKKLFSRSIANGSSREKETPKNIALKVKELPEHVKYDGGWFDELDELKLSSSSSDEPTFFSKADAALLDPLRETTPRGDIIMYYDTETKSFNYYSNSKNIPYSTLDAVARKYVCLHKDPSIYIDIRNEVQKGREKCFKQDKDNKSKLAKLERNKDKSGNEILSSAKKSLFAAFKNYKTGRNVPKSLHNYDEKKEMVIMKDNVNKFVYKGTFDQYEFDVNSHKNKKHSPPSSFKYETNNVNCNETIVVENQDKYLSYADFKKNLIKKK
jgi:hypothetical protein